MHPTIHAYALARGQHPERLRQHGYLTRSIADLVEPERHQRQTPGRSDDAADADRVVLIAAGMTLQIRDVRVPQRNRAPTQDNGESDDGEHLSPHCEHPLNPYCEHPLNPQSGMWN